MRRLIIFLLFLSNFAFSTEITNPENYVSDYANMITSDDEAMLNKIISDYEKRTEIEIAVVTIESLNGDDISNAAQNMFQKLGVGKREVNNGILILLAKDERKWNIHTGYGVESALPDIICKRIGENLMVPNFKKGDFGMGIKLAINEFIKTIGNSKEDIRLKQELEEKKKQERADNIASFFFMVDVYYIYCNCWIFDW